MGTTEQRCRVDRHLRLARKRWLARSVIVVVPTLLRLLWTGRHLVTSLVLVTVMLNVSETVADPSLAVTFTTIVPTSEFVGVPEKVRVEVLKDNQEGRDEPFESVAV